MSDYKILIYTRDGKMFELRHASYECDGMVLIINQGDNQYIFPMDWVEHIEAEVEEDE